MKRYRLPILVVALITTGLLFARVQHREPTLEDQATATLPCLLTGDADCIASRMMEEEIKAGWTRENVRYVYDEIINPFWKRQQPVGKPMGQSLTYQDLAGQEYRLTNGIPLRRIVSLESDGQTGRMLVSDDLINTFNAMSLVAHSKTADFDFMVRGPIEGIDRYGDALKKRGVKGLVRKDSAGRLIVVPFDQARENARAYMARIANHEIRIVAPREGGTSP